MAVVLTNGVDGVFDRLGKIFDYVQKKNTHQELIDTEYDDILDSYNNDRELAAELPLTQESTKLSSASSFTEMQTVARRTVIEMVHDDNPLISKTIGAAVQELITQMIGSGTPANPDDSVKGQTIGLVETKNPSNAGTGDLIFNALNADGVESQTVRTETVKLVCTSDAQVRGTSGRETFQVESTQAYPDIRDPNWPGGAGMVSSVRVSDPAENGQTIEGRNKLVNSAFREFTVPDVPDNWNIIVGGAGTIGENGAGTYRGAKNLQYTGDVGGTLQQIQQRFGTSGETTQKLKPSTRYVCSFQVKQVGVVTGGILDVAVKDGLGNVLDGGAAKTQVTLTGLSSAVYSQGSFTFVTPDKIPDGTQMVVEMSTALPNTEAVLIEDLILTEQVQHFGAAGPFVNVFPGDVPWVVGDEVEVEITNSYAGRLQFNSDKLLGLHGMGLQWPYKSDGSETVPDTLIV